jgi:hypothetical protein
MELRKHPLVSYRNQSSWPPAWIWIAGNENKHPRGEVDVLKQLKLVDGPFVNRCFYGCNTKTACIWDACYLAMLLSANKSRSYSKSIAATRLNTSAVWILHICYENNAGETFGVAGSMHVRESFLGT